MLSASIPNNVRKEIYRRDGFACALCGDPRRLQIHHVVPRSRGGGSGHHNLITLCMICHALAHGQYLEETDLTQDDVELACVEYVSDMYAGDWSPFSWPEQHNMRR